MIESRGPEIPVTADTDAIVDDLTEGDMALVEDSVLQSGIDIEALFAPAAVEVEEQEERPDPLKPRRPRKAVSFMPDVPLERTPVPTGYPGKNIETQPAPPADIEKANALARYQALVKRDHAIGKPLHEIVAKNEQEQEQEDEPEWQDYANCFAVDPDLFFPERGASTQEAKEVCRGCVVREDCLEYALANGEKFGIWGGMSERERRRIRRQRVVARTALAKAGANVEAL